MATFKAQRDQVAELSLAELVVPVDLVLVDFMQDRDLAAVKAELTRDDNGSIRKVWSDDREVCFGVVGTVGDLSIPQ